MFRSGRRVRVIAELATRVGQAAEPPAVRGREGTPIGRGVGHLLGIEANEPLQILHDASLVAELPSRLEQPAFERTGGLHATGLFDTHGQLLFSREDVGRHNAMDKVVGHALVEGLLPLGERVLCVSGRLSFELVQKAAVAGAPILVGVGAPSSLAIELAEDRGLTLCGFARRGKVNVYTRPERIAG